MAFASGHVDRDHVNSHTYTVSHVIIIIIHAFHFVCFAETCFRLFGDRVKNWPTLNETQTFAYYGYGLGAYAPGRCSPISGTIKPSYVGDSSTEPYLCTHHALLAHAAAVKVYRSKYQNGRIGISVNSRWYEPYTSSEEDERAAERCVEFELYNEKLTAFIKKLMCDVVKTGLLDPLFLGDYPRSMRTGAGDRLPVFTDEERIDLVGSMDFLGFNYYTAYYARNAPPPVEPSQRWYMTDRLAEEEYVGVDGQWIGEPYGPKELRWIYNCPWALPKLLQWRETRYGRRRFEKSPIIITENGTMDNELDLPIDEPLNDSWRVKYMEDTLVHLADAIRNNHYNVEGYFAWSLLDNFEWSSGLVCRFGLHYVDYKDKDLKRYPKSSALWYHSLITQSAGNENKDNVSISKCGVVTNKSFRKVNRTCNMMLGSWSLIESIWELFRSAMNKESVLDATPLVQSKG